MLVFTEIITSERLDGLADEGLQLLKILAKARSNTK